MSLLARNAGARIGVRIGGILLGLVAGVIIVVILAAISSLAGSMAGTGPKGAGANPFVFGLLGWLSAEVLIWLAVRRSPALPKSARPEMPDELPVTEPISFISTVYPDARRAAALPKLPARTPDPETQAHIRSRIDGLRQEFSVESAYERADTARRPEAEAWFAHEKGLLGISKTAERNAAIALILAAGLFLPVTFASGFSLALWAIVLLALTWVLTKVLRKHLVPRLRRSGARGVDGIDRPRFISVTPFLARGSVGGNLAGAAEEFGQKLVDIGISGEIRTARLLDSSLAGITRVAVFHSLRFPGLDRADVDHVVLLDTGNGPALIVIDSKAWKPGTWEQDSPETVTHVPSGDVRESIMPLAVQKFAELGFPTSAQTVIHASSRSVEVQGLTGSVHRYVDSETLVKSILDRRNSAPVLRSNSDPEMVKFVRLRDDLNRRLVS